MVLGGREGVREGRGRGRGVLVEGRCRDCGVVLDGLVLLLVGRGFVGGGLRLLSCLFRSRLC